MRRLDFSLLSINTATTRAQHTLEQAIRDYAAAGVAGIAPWRDKLAECGVGRAAQLIADHGLTVTGLCRGGMFPWNDAARRQAVRDDNLKAIEEAAAIKAQCLILVCGGLPAGSRDVTGAREMVAEMIAEIAPLARAADVPLAIEPLHPMYAADRSVINTLAQANDLCDRIGQGVGVAVDVYHVWWDPNVAREIARAGAAGRIHAFHLCDWRVPTRDLLLDRAMMGDGAIDLKHLRNLVEGAGYAGLYEVEIFSELDWWQRPASEVIDTVKARFLAVC